MISFLCLLAIARAAEVHKETRRLLWEPFPTEQIDGLATSVGQIVGSKMEDKQAKEESARRLGGLREDNVCTKTMRIAKQLPFLKDLLMNEGEDNMLPLDQTVDGITRMCQIAAKTDVLMNQCTFYVTMAKLIDEEFLGGFWLNAFGNLKDKLHGCGAVVNMVHTVIENGGIFNVRRAELDGQEVFVAKDEDHGTFRRLIGAAATGVVGAGAYLAHVCKSFDDDNHLIA